MSLYSQINSFFDNERNILKVIDLYCYIRDLVKDIKSEKDDHYYDSMEKLFYRELTEYGQNVSKEQHMKYLDSFYNNIYYPVCEHSFEIIRRVNPQLKIFNKFNSYKEIEAEYEKIDARPFGERWITDEEKLIERVIGQIEDCFTFRGHGSMGFHISPHHLSPDRDDVKKVKNNIKFYLNGGPSIYKFAKLFKEKCEEQGLNYYFKVADPREWDDRRTEKMCVYSSYDNVGKIIKVMRDIKKDHPEIEFEEPPILGGRIDDFIGVGQDHIFNEGSYNSNLAKISYYALERVFGHYDAEDIMNEVMKNPSLIKRVKDSFIEEVKKYGIDPKTMCTGLSEKKSLESIELSDDTDLSSPVSDEERVLKENLQHLERLRKLSNDKSDDSIPFVYIPSKNDRSNISSTTSKKDDLDKEIEELEKKVAEQDKKIKRYSQQIDELEKKLNIDYSVFTKLFKK